MYVLSYYNSDYVRTDVAHDGSSDITLVVRYKLCLLLRYKNQMHTVQSIESIEKIKFDPISQSNPGLGVNMFHVVC